MNDVYEVLSAPGFQRIMHNISMVCLFLAIATALASMTFYGRGRDAGAQDNWAMLFASWRDSLIITVLFAAQSFSYRALEFSALSQMQPDRVFLYVPLVQPVLAFAADVVIFTIAILRVIALSRWIAARQSAEP